MEEWYWRMLHKRSYNRNKIWATKMMISPKYFLRKLEKGRLHKKPVKKELKK